MYALYALSCTRDTVCRSCARVYVYTYVYREHVHGLTRLHGSLADTWCSRFVARSCHDNQTGRTSGEKERGREGDGEKVKGLSRCHYIAGIRSAYRHYQSVNIDADLPRRIFDVFDTITLMIFARFLFF